MPERSARLVQKNNILVREHMSQDRDITGWALFGSTDSGRHVDGSYYVAQYTVRGNTI